MVDLYLGVIIGIVLGVLLSFLVYKFSIEKNTLDQNNLSEFKSQISQLKEDLDKVSSDISTERGSFREMIQNMASSKLQFEKIAQELKNTLVSGGNQKQGQWGEMLLNYILQNKLGMTEGEEFKTQSVFHQEEEGRLKPDVIVHLPNGRDIVIDSKVSLKDWDDYSNATDEVSKEISKSAHIESLKRHIRSLSGKNYSSIYGIKSLDAVIMFVPNEHAISSLGKESRDLTDFALDKKITIVGPSMIYYLLKSVDQQWKSEKQKNNIEKIIKIASSLYDKGVDIYQAAFDAMKSLGTVDEKLQNVMSKVKDGRSSLLKDLEKMRIVGGVNSKKSLPEDIKSELAEEVEELEPEQIEMEGSKKQ